MIGLNRPQSSPHGRRALSDAVEILCEELDGIVDRHFTAHRTLIVSNDEGKFWTAAIGDKVLYRSPDGRATLRFARTFAERTPGVEVVVSEWQVSGDWSQEDPLRVRQGEQHSVRVPLRVVT